MKTNFFISYFLYVTLLFCVVGCNKKNDTATTNTSTNNIIQFVFTSDQHYGLTKANFQGNINVDAHIVNASLVTKLNTLSTTSFPVDGGLQSGNKINYMDAIISAGDFANREEGGIQSATTSWNQFVADYINGNYLKNKSNNITPLYIVPGNHDVSNAIGYYKTMNPVTDAMSMISMYNLVMNPSISKTNSNYNYVTDKIHYSVDIAGIHLMFLNLWPDSTERIWMTNDLKNVSIATPVLLFAHSIPDVESRFFTNPNGMHDINSVDKFENLLSEVFKDGNKTINDLAIMEQRGFASFLKNHTNIKAYFHGHTNYNQFYDWTGPDNDIVLHCFRVDSPLKGSVSSTDETKLSFQVIVIDTLQKIITVRECLWNPSPSVATTPVTWGSSITVSIK
jgi:Calcineurin-like phosphoesterase